MNAKSVIVQKFGSYDSLSVGDFPLPEIDDSYVEVDVKYGGLNFFDLCCRQGLMKDKMKCPFVLGIECSGVVTAVVGESNIKVGQRVICYHHEGGMFRQRVRISSKRCFPIPDDVSFDLAAIIFFNYLTAYFAVFRQGNLRPFETVLIMSCAGGVGLAATQLAKTIDGVTVLGTGSPDKRQFALQNGVDIFIPTDGLEKYLKSNQIAIDVIITGKSAISMLFPYLKPLGRAVILGAGELIRHENELGFWDMLRMIPSYFLTNLIRRNHCVSGLHLGLLVEQEENVVRRALDDVWRFLREGRIKPHVHAEFEMTDVVAAMKELAEAKNIGKVILKIGDGEK